MADAPIQKPALSRGIDPSNAGPCQSGRSAVAVRERSCYRAKTVPADLQTSEATSAGSGYGSLQLLQSKAWDPWGTDLLVDQIRQAYANDPWFLDAKNTEGLEFVEELWKDFGHHPSGYTSLGTSCVMGRRLQDVTGIVRAPRTDLERRPQTSC